jgi:hypothetical protein
MDYPLGEAMRQEGLEEIRRDIEVLVEKLDRMIEEGKAEES